MALYLNTERDGGRGEGGGGTDVKREGWRDSGRKGEIERGEKTEGFLGVGFWIWCTDCFGPDARRRG